MVSASCLDIVDRFIIEGFTTHNLFFSWMRYQGLSKRSERRVKMKPDGIWRLEAALNIERKQASAAK